MNTQRKNWIKWAVGLAFLGLVALFPFLPIPVPGILPRDLNHPGTLLLLVTCFINIGLALTYRLLLGVTGLLSFGHALFFGAGAYSFGIILDQFGLPVVWAILLSLIFGLALSMLVGAIALRVSGIPFAMVTLAFGHAGAVLVTMNSTVTGGEEGLNITQELRDQDLAFATADARFPFWIALSVVVVVFLILALVEHSRAGHVATAIRENELRVNVLGLKPYVVKWIMFVAAGSLASVIGTLFIFTQRVVSTTQVKAELTIAVLLMAVLGGLGSKWGAVIGAFVYTILNNRLIELSNSEFIASLPDFLRIPLKEPTFILGVLFILVVLFLPGGIQGGIDKLTASFKSMKLPEKQTQDA